MLYAQRRMTIIVFFLMPFLLILFAVAISTPARAETGKAKVDRLVMGLINPYHDYVRPWISGTADHNIQHDPMLEWLFEIDAETGQFVPWLAKSWELAPDGKSWRIQLQEGVQFHHGYGEFTAKDVVHSHALWCDDTYAGRKDPPTTGYRNGICTVERIEVMNDHEIVMHCKSPCLDVPFYYSEAANVMMSSKAQWDKEGEMALETKPAGGAPFDPNRWRPLDTPSSIEDAPTGGMGISLVRELSGPIQYTRVGVRNRVVVRIPRQKHRYT